MSASSGKVLQVGAVWAAVGSLVLSLSGVTAALVAGIEPGPALLAFTMLAWLAVLLVFPSGAPQPRWLWVIAVSSGVGVLAREPLAFVAGFAALAVAQVWRYHRRSSLVERQATKWLLLGLVPAMGLFLGVGLVAALPSGSEWVLDHPVYAGLSLVGMWGVPVAAAAGLVLGERGPVDELVRFVVTVVGASVVVAVGYQLVEGAAPAWATVVACLLVLPGFWAARRVGTVLAYARGPQRPLAALPHALAATTGPDAVGPVVAAALREALASPASEVRVGADVVGRSGSGAGPLLEVPVTLHQDEVAVLAVAPREGEGGLGRRDRRVVEQIAIIAAPALSGVRSARAAADAHRMAATARARERDRLHADLHDELGPALSGLAMTAAAASARLEGEDPAAAKALVTDLREGISRTATLVRELAYDLRPAELTRVGFELLLHERLAGPPPPEVILDVTLGEPPLPEDLQVALLRVTAEAVNNVRRHAAAARCTVSVRQAGMDLVVVVEDDGCGTTTDAEPGIGLRSIRQRATSFGGHATLEPAPDGGSRLTASFVIPTGPAQ